MRPVPHAHQLPSARVNTRARTGGRALVVARGRAERLVRAPDHTVRGPADVPADLARAARGLPARVLARAGARERARADEPAELKRSRLCQRARRGAGAPARTEDLKLPLMLCLRRPRSAQRGADDGRARRTYHLPDVLDAPLLLFIMIAKKYGEGWRKGREGS
jgi:hypothetical protein